MRRGERGYTAVEVLCAMTLFAIGAAGVIGMQKVTIQGGQDARQLDIANNIAHEWIARLQRDAMAWTQPSSTFPNQENVTTSTVWLRDIGTGPCTPPNYCSPPGRAAGTEAGMSGAFDIFGRDRPSDANDHHFCVQYRLAWIYPLGNAPQLSPNALMRVEVRVFWTRLELAPIGNCATLPVSPDSIQAASTYHFVYAVSAVREAQGP